MKKSALLVSLILFIFCSNAQTAKKEEDIITYVEQEAEFPGGKAAMDKFLAENLIYPSTAKEMRFETTVTIRFMVDSNGVIANVEALTKRG